MRSQEVLVLVLLSCFKGNSHPSHLLTAALIPAQQQLGPVDRTQPGLVSSPTTNTPELRSHIFLVSVMKSSPRIKRSLKRTHPHRLFLFCRRMK